MESPVALFPGKGFGERDGKPDAFEINGGIIVTLKGFNPTFHEQPDYSEQDREQVFVTVLNVLRNILFENIHPEISKMRLRRQYCNNLGLTAKSIIIIGASDGCIATPGSAARGEGKSTITIGVSGAVRVARWRILKARSKGFLTTCFGRQLCFRRAS